MRVYELTARGRELEGPLEAIAPWGYELLDGVPRAEPDVRVQTDFESFATLAERLRPDEGDRVRVDGDAERLRRLLRGFRRPSRTVTCVP